MKKSFTVPVLLILLLLAACGQQESQNIRDETNAVAIQASRSDTYWTEKKWIHNKSMGSPSQHPLYLTEELNGLDAEPEEAYDERSVAYCALGNTVYSLESFYRKEGENRKSFYYLGHYNGASGEIAHCPVELPSPAEYGMTDFTMAAFDVQDQQELVLFLQGQQDQLLAQGCYLAVHISTEGKTLSVTDLYPALKEVDVEMGVTYDKAYVDGAGYYYLISGQAYPGKGNQVSVLDPDGIIIGTLPPYDGYTDVKWAMKLPDGSPVFSWSNEKQMRIMLQTFDRERKTAHTLLESEYLTDAWLWTPGEDGYLYYVSSSGELTRCDIRTGSVEECIHYPQLGMDGDRRSAHLVRMIVGPDGQPEFLGSKEGKTTICRLGTEKPGNEVIRLLSDSGFSNYLKDGAAAYSQKNPDCPAVLEYPEENKEDYWDRAMAELMSGQGADIYYVSLAEMRMLQKKGVLADLSELISDETLEILWPAARETGTVDGHLSGIPLEARVESMLVSDDIWTGDHWTLEEALDVLEAHPEKQYPLMSHLAFDKYDVLSWLALKSLADSPFLDLEKGICDFENPLFIRTLELAGSCTKSFDFQEAQSLYPEKDWTAMMIPVNIGNFEDFKSVLGEDYHIVGFPTTGESGTYWSNERLLVVNRETAHTREVGLLLEELLSYDRQCTLYASSPVRRDTLDHRLTPHSIGGVSGMYIEYGNGMMKELTPGPEGDYRIGEFNAIMEKSAGRTMDTDAIAEIILEESGSCFSGDRDAAAVAHVIQNRVQLYLNERQ